LGEGKDEISGLRHLIPTERIEIHPQLLDIHASMRRQRYPVYAQQRPGHFMHLLRYAPDIVDRAQDIARVRTGHEDRLVGHQWPQVLGRQAQIRGFAGRGPPFQDEVLRFGHPHPGGDVGFVVEGREDDLGAGAERKGLGEVGEELGC